MTEPRVSQIATVSVTEVPASPRLSQMASVTVAEVIVAPRLSQIVMISVTENFANLLVLKDAYKLPCMNTCTVHAEKREFGDGR